MAAKKKASPSPVTSTVTKPRGEGSLSQLDYILQFHDLFIEQQEDANPARKFITVEELSADHEIDAATVKRYLRFMRDRLHLPVAGIRSRGGQGYTQKVHSFPFHLITEGDMLLFVLAKRAFGEGTPFAHRFEPLRQKVLASLRDAAVDLERLESVVHFHHTGFDTPVPLSPETWDLLANAAMHCKELRCQHRKAEQGAVLTQRTLWPLGLSEIGNAWYLWALEPENPPMFPKSFLISRMSDFQETGRIFERIAFDPTIELKNCVGLHGAREEAEDMHLHITGKHAKLVAERPLHELQRIETRSDGSIDVFLHVVHTPELESLILMRAGSAEVLEPATLRLAIHQKHAEGMKRNA